MMLLLCASVASAQWRPVQPYFMRYYGLRADSGMMVPRDTIGPAADSALLGYKNRTLWIKTDTGWASISDRIGVDSLNRFYFNGWKPSYHSVYNAAEGAVLTVQGDTIINIFRLDTARQHAGGKGQIVKRYSYDNGITWTTPEVIFDSQYDDRNVVAGVLSSGRISVLFRQYDGNNLSGTTISVGRIYSDDGGQNWSSYAAITGTETGNRVFFGPVTQAGDGEYKVCLYATDKSYTFSSADGANWNEQSMIFDYSGDPKTPSETAICYIGTNRMIALSRDDSSPDSSYYQHTSSNNGLTWSYVGRTNMNNELLNVNRTPPTILYDELRNVVVAISTTRNSTINGAPWLYRQDSMYLYINRPDSVFNNPKKWSVKISMGRPMPAQFTPFYGYPTITKLNNGNYFGIITEMAPVSIADAASGSYEYDYLYQFDLNYVTSAGSIGQSRYPGLTPIQNTNTGLLDNKSNITPFADGIDSLSLFAYAKTLRVGTLANAPTLDGFQLVDNDQLRVFRMLGNGQLVAGTPTGPGAINAVTADGFNILNEVRGFNASTGAENWRITNTGLMYLGTTTGSDRMNISGNGNISGNWTVGGSITATGNSVTSSEFRGPVFNGNSSSGTVKLYGGATSGFKGGAIDLIAGAAGANPGTIAFRSGTTGGGVDQPINMRLDALGKLSVGGDVPISTLDVQGSLGTAILITSGSVALSASHCTVIVTSTSASVTLPTPSASNIRRIYRLVNYDAGGNVTISSVNRDGAATTLLPNNAKWTVQSDGTNWYVIQD